jgi:hypothetical protein
MIKNIYSVYDSAAKAYMQPFYCSQDGEAVRLVEGNVNSQEDSIISRNPDQFTLFKLGKFDDQTGQIEKLDVPESIVPCISLKIEDTAQTTAINDLIAKVEKLISNI